MIELHDSLSGQRKPLKPLIPNVVRLYVCGITVYDYCHVGHARFMIVFDMLARYLRAQGMTVRYVRNITDIDDKIIKKAADTGQTVAEVAEQFARAMREDEAAMGLEPPDMEPAATHYVAEMQTMIEKLVEKEAAYVGDNGDVYYDVSTFERYGALSKRKLSDLRSGSRVEVNQVKTDPLDFVLWKAAKPDEPSWDSPWGKGRPGWHIECSAMSTECLGASFDIHGGGLDLQFPHHENEIAQSEAATGETYAGLWMHNGFVTVDDEKMSKSLGNFLTVRDVLDRYDAEVLRYFVLSTHYRSPLAYNVDAMEQAAAALSRLYTALRDCTAQNSTEVDADDAELGAYRQRFADAMADDLNTPAALAVLFDMARDANRNRDESPRRAARQADTLKLLAEQIGLLQQTPQAFLQRQSEQGESGLSSDDVQQMIEQRRTAREARDFAEADRIRDVLVDGGIVLEDSAQGTTWRRG